MNAWRVALRGLLAAVLLTPALPARAEPQQPCVDRNEFRNPYFGDTHVHTSLSFDANALGVRTTPRDAYRFARGEPLGLQPWERDGTPRRSVRLLRPLDFAVVTDHAEILGETHICQTPGLRGHASLVCRFYRRWPLLAYYAVNSRIFNVSDPQRYRFCGTDGRHCLKAAAKPWARIQEAAEEFQDRSEACSFTTFVGYEWSGNPDSSMIHRNVIFRSEVVPALPTSYVDEPTPEGLWRRLRRDCLEAGTGCDVLTIPHNANLSGGRLFAAQRSDGSPLTRSDALERARFEPLVEVMQHKGDSECRAGASDDPLCGFEKLPFAKMDQLPFPFLWAGPPPGSTVREALAEGLRQEELLGANPFKLGILAATDTHLGTPGLVDEEGYPGHGAGGDTTRVEIPLLPDFFAFNPGGLAGVWAEENSREAIFRALRRREVYGTSGPRMVVRFFGGWSYPGDLCRSPRRVEEAYAGGVPMGGDLPPPPGAAGTSTPPVFALWARSDPGSGARPGAPLERAQIVKLWRDAQGARERVFDVARAGGDARVDPATCRRRGRGPQRLCAVWRDPAWLPDEHALYYARVVESPSCRWSAYACNARGVDCTDPRSVPDELETCCDPSAPRTLQERAWTSPIWYAPAVAPGSAAANVQPHP